LEPFVDAVQELGPPARFELPLPDPQVAREFGWNHVVRRTPNAVVLQRFPESGLSRFRTKATSAMTIAGKARTMTRARTFSTD
jgi:hypothetical protein